MGNKNPKIHPPEYPCVVRMTRGRICVHVMEM